MSRVNGRADVIAADIFEKVGSSFITRRQLRDYLHCSHATTIRLTAAIAPAFANKYFYRDVAEVLAQGYEV